MYTKDGHTFLQAEQDLLKGASKLESLCALQRSWPSPVFLPKQDRSSGYPVPMLPHPSLSCLQTVWPSGCSASQVADSSPCCCSHSSCQADIGVGVFTPASMLLCLLPFLILTTMQVLLLFFAVKETEGQEDWSYNWLTAVD